MSVTTWIRLDPSARDADLRASLAARVADPLWLLARQWQIGEREGEDAGSPVVARLLGETNQLGRFRAGPTGQPARSYDPRAVPLEAMVERENVRDGKLDRRLAAEAGLHFLRLVAAAGVTSLRAAYLANYPLAPLSAAELDLIDDDSRVFLQMIQGRALDGNALYTDLVPTLRPATGSPTLPALPAVSGPDTPKVINAGLAYLTWYETLFSVPSANEHAWSGERMEYSFAVSAQGTGGEIVLTAPDYSDGRLDWHDLDLDRSGASLGGAGELPPAVPIDFSAQPGPVTFKGMPAHRFWEFEDAQVDLGALDVSTSDLPRLLLMEFAFFERRERDLAQQRSRSGLLDVSADGDGRYRADAASTLQRPAVHGASGTRRAGRSRAGRRRAGARRNGKSGMGHRVQGRGAQQSWHESAGCLRGASAPQSFAATSPAGAWQRALAEAICPAKFHPRPLVADGSRQSSEHRSGISLSARADGSPRRRADSCSGPNSRA